MHGLLSKRDPLRPNPVGIIGRFPLGDGRVVEAEIWALQVIPDGLVKALLSLEVKITDAGVAHLRGLPRLQIVALEEAAITDAGLAHLKALTQLQELSLKGTEVTETGIRELQKAQPKVKVER